MNRKKRLLSGLALTMIAFACVMLVYEPSTTQKPITEMGDFEEMNLQDFYKVNYQSFFGAEHMAPDTTSVYAYLCQELTQDSLLWLIPDFQYINGYYRVSLRLIPEGVLPMDTLVYAFMESARPVQHEEGEWLERWQKIEKKVLKNYPALADSCLQAELMEAATLNAAVRHSQHYRDTYQPHYRIIREDIVQRWEEEGLIKTDEH